MSSQRAAAEVAIRIAPLRAKVSGILDRATSPFHLLPARIKNAYIALDMMLNDPFVKFMLRRMPLYPTCMCMPTIVNHMY